MPCWRVLVGNCARFDENKVPRKRSKMPPTSATMIEEGAPLSQSECTWNHRDSELVNSSWKTWYYVARRENMGCSDWNKVGTPSLLNLVLHIYTNKAFHSPSTPKLSQIICDQIWSKNFPLPAIAKFSIVVRKPPVLVKIGADIPPLLTPPPIPAIFYRSYICRITAK